MPHRLEPLLNPASIDVIGASDNAARIGGIALTHLTHLGYKGAVYPVNPKYEEVFGLKCWSDIESVPMQTGSGRVSLLTQSGKPPGDVDATCKAIAGFSSAVLALQEQADEVEINPLLVKENGQGVRMLDALVISGR